MTAQIIARTTRGLEWITADELSQLPGVDAVEIGDRKVEATVADPGAALGLRTADDVFVRVGTVSGLGRGAATPEAAAAAVVRLDLAPALGAVGRLRALPPRPALDVVASLDGDRRFGRYDLEEAVGASLATLTQGTYRSRRHGRPPPADLSLRLAVTGSTADVGVRLADRPLHRRAWKVATGPATLHPPVAAALVRLAGMRRAVVLDPMCGDGTILIEAITVGHLALGTDLDPTRLAHARANAAAAGAALPLLRGDAGHLGLAGGAGCGAAVVTNPPWEVAVAGAGRLQRGLAPAWAEAGRLLGGGGVLVTVVDAALGTPDRLAHSGWSVAVADRIRVQGRVCDLVVAADRAADPLPPSLRRWHAAARPL